MNIINELITFVRQARTRSPVAPTTDAAGHNRGSGDTLGASGGREAPGSANTQERQGLARLDCVAPFQKGASIAGQVELEGKD